MSVSNNLSENNLTLLDVYEDLLRNIMAELFRSIIRLFSNVGLAKDHIAGADHLLVINGDNFLHGSALRGNSLPPTKLGSSLVPNITVSPRSSVNLL